MNGSPDQPARPVPRRTLLGHGKAMLRDAPVVREGLLWAMSRVRSVATAPPGLYTLCYHRVAGAERDGFTRQLRHLAGHGTFVGADRAAELVATGTAESGRFFLVTFDDGYADTIDVALPVLREAGLPAILFVVSGWLDAPPASESRRDGYATRADLHAWLRAGLSVGSHSATHRRFSTLSAAEAEAEFAASQHSLAAVTGGPVRHFACPWGVAGADYDPARDPALAARHGFRTFFTTRRARARAGADLLALPRHVAEPGWGLYQLDALLGGG